MSGSHDEGESETGVESGGDGAQDTDAGAAEIEGTAPGARFAGSPVKRGGFLLGVAAVLVSFEGRYIESSVLDWLGYGRYQLLSATLGVALVGAVFVTERWTEDWWGALSWAGTAVGAAGVCVASFAWVTGSPPTYAAVGALVGGALVASGAQDRDRRGVSGGLVGFGLDGLSWVGVLAAVSGVALALWLWWIGDDAAAFGAVLAGLSLGFVVATRGEDGAYDRAELAYAGLALVAAGLFGLPAAGVVLGGSLPADPAVLVAAGFLPWLATLVVPEGEAADDDATAED